MEKLPYITYNSANNNFARENRKNQTYFESKIRNLFLKYRPLWYKFTRQKPINSFILDFYCSKLLLWIEIDWEYHDFQKEYDLMRDIKIWKNSIKVLRYSNKNIKYNFNLIKYNIEKQILKRNLEIKKMCNIFLNE